MGRRHRAACAIIRRRSQSDLATTRQPRSRRPTSGSGSGPNARCRPSVASCISDTASRRRALVAAPQQGVSEVAVELAAAQHREQLGDVAEAHVHALAGERVHRGAASPTSTILGAISLGTRISRSGKACAA